MNAAAESIENDNTTDNTFSMLRGKMQDAIMDSIESMGFIHPTEVQIKTLPHILYGKDLLVLSERRSGNTLAYLIPVLEIMMRMQFEPRDGIGCIIMTTRGRVDKTYLTLERMLQCVPLTAAVARKMDDINVIKEILTGGVNILVGTPNQVGKLLISPEVEDSSVANVKILVIAGTNGYISIHYEHQIPLVISKIPKDRQIILFSNEREQQLISLIKYLRIDFLTIDCIKETNTSRVHQPDSNEQVNTPQQDCVHRCDVYSHDSNQLPLHQSTITSPNSMPRCNIYYNSNILPPNQNTARNDNCVPKCDTNHHSNDGVQMVTFRNDEQLDAEKQISDVDKCKHMLFIAYNHHLKNFLQIGVEYNFACTLAHMQVSKLLQYDWDSLSLQEIATILEIDPLFSSTESYRNMLVCEKKAIDELNVFLNQSVTIGLIMCYVVNITRMNEEQIKLVQGALTQQILMIPPKSRAPRFVSSMSDIESLRFKCIDIRTLDWLTNVVAGLKIWPDCELSVIENVLRPKCNIITIPLHRITEQSIDTIIKSFEIQNYGLITKYWRCIEWKNGKKKCRQSLTCVIDDYSFCVLKLMKLALFYGLQRVPVYVVAMSENVESVEIECRKPNTSKSSGIHINKVMKKAIQKEKIELGKDISELILNYKINRAGKEANNIHTF